jgi:hypothetical protein
MRKLLKILHTIGSCGLIGGLAGYMAIWAFAPQETAADFAAARLIIGVLGNFLLIPSLGVCLVTGLLAMAVHRPFQERRWVWVKAALGIGMFEGTMGLVQSKADYAARVSTELADKGAASTGSDVASGWPLLTFVMALAILNVVLGVWRPALRRS